MKTVAGSEMSQVSGNYHEHKEPVVMVMASIDVKIRHVFGFTFSWRAAGVSLPKLRNIF